MVAGYDSAQALMSFTAYAVISKCESQEKISATAPPPGACSLSHCRGQGKDTSLPVSCQRQPDMKPKAWGWGGEAAWESGDLGLSGERKKKSTHFWETAHVDHKELRRVLGDLCKLV